jgi:predicted PurR-regulated permease PerM
MDRPPASDLTRTTLSVLSIGLLIAASLWVMLPFAGAIVWATMIVVATWPIMLSVQALAGGRRWIAVTVMTLVMLLFLVVPLVLVVSTILEHVNDLVALRQSVTAFKLPSPPSWVESVPLLGPKIAAEWRNLAEASTEDLIVRATPYLRTAMFGVAGKAGGFALLLVHFLLTVVITAVLYTTGEVAANGVRRFARRLGGDRGEGSVVLAGQAIRAVALGVVVTALVQSAAAGLGLVVSGVPYAGVLTAIIFILCIAQAGPLLVLVPAVLWMFWSGDVGWGSALLVWTVLVGALDNVLRPILIRRGADLPLLLIFAGVIGGLIGFGIIGLFVGPVVLAITYRLLEAWVADIDDVTAQAAGGVSQPSARNGARAVARPRPGTKNG